VRWSSRAGLGRATRCGPVGGRRPPGRRQPRRPAARWDRPRRYGDRTAARGPCSVLVARRRSTGRLPVAPGGGRRRIGLVPLGAGRRPDDRAGGRRAHTGVRDRGARKRHRRRGARAPGPSAPRRLPRRPAPWRRSSPSRRRSTSWSSARGGCRAAARWGASPSASPTGRSRRCWWSARANDPGVGRGGIGRISSGGCLRTRRGAR